MILFEFSTQINRTTTRGTRGTRMIHSLSRLESADGVRGADTVNRNRANFQTEIGIPPLRIIHPLSSPLADRQLSRQTVAPYRRESWNCSIKQPFHWQISLVTRVYLVMAVSRPAAFPRNFRLVTERLASPQGTRSNLIPPL